MKTLTLKNKSQSNVTLVANTFIDHYLAPANGEFVKVYLFLLRHLNAPCSLLTVSAIADCLNNTENDILRAFRYWETAGLLTLRKDSDGNLTAIELEPTPSISARKQADTQHVDHETGFVSVDTEPAIVTTALRTSPKAALQPVLKPDSHNGIQTSLSRVSQTAKISGQNHDTPTEMKSKAIPLTSFKAQKELKSLLFIAEQYLGKILSRTEVDAITYFYESLNMSADLIEYLIESCVENGHKSIRYIQKVALSWSDSGVSCVEQAKQHAQAYHKNSYTVLNTFGIKNRGPAVSELNYIKKWTEEFCFSLDIIEEACNRTITAIHQPSFEYADTILSKWHEHQVRHLKDVAILDAAYEKDKAVKKPVDLKQKPVSKNLNNFERRAYDMDSLEEKLLNSN